MTPPATVLRSTAYVLWECHACGASGAFPNDGRIPGIHRDARAAQEWDRHRHPRMRGRRPDPHLETAVWR